MGSDEPRFPWINCPLCKGKGGALDWGGHAIEKDWFCSIEPCHCDKGGDEYAKQIERRREMDYLDSYAAFDRGLHDHR